MIESNAEPSNPSSRWIARRGGEQFLRNAISCSAVLQKPILICSDRKGRAKDGLSVKHLTPLQISRYISGGTLKRVSLYSLDVSFSSLSLSNSDTSANSTTSVYKHKKSMTSNSIFGDARTAGSICLLIREVLPVYYLGLENLKLDLRGGADADKTPPCDFFSTVRLPVA